MVSRAAYLGVESHAFKVQCQIAPGTPDVASVSLPDKLVSENSQRVHPALSAMGLSLPRRHITGTLSPADLSKEGSHYDLPVTLTLPASCLPGSPPQLSPAEALEVSTVTSVARASEDPRRLALPRPPKGRPK